MTPIPRDQRPLKPPNRKMMSMSPIDMLHCLLEPLADDDGGNAFTSLARSAADRADGPTLCEDRTQL